MPAERSPLQPRPSRCATRLGWLLLIAALGVGPLSPPPEPPPPPQIVSKVGVDQNLDAALPMDLLMRDEQGSIVRLGSLFRGKPVVITPVYFRCPSLCTVALNGVTRSFQALPLDVGEDFDVITYSFDPTETPALAAEKKSAYVRQYGRDEQRTRAGWHFLTGDAAAVEKLNKVVGFRSIYNERTGQYAHAAAIMVATPQGRLSRYFYGIDYASKDLRLGLVEASQNRIGSIADQILLTCYKYDPVAGRYGFAVVTALRASAGATVVLLAGLVGLFLWRERRNARRLSAATAMGEAPAP